MKIFGNQQLECLQGYIFFQAETHIYPRPSKSPLKKVVYHIIFIVLAVFQGIWSSGYMNVPVWEYIYIYLVVQTIVPHNPCVPSAFPGVFLETYIYTWYVQYIYIYLFIYLYRKIFFWKHDTNPPIHLLEYASARPCTLHPMRFPEAMFFLTRIYTHIYIYLYILICFGYVQYIYTYRRTEN